MTFWRLHESETKYKQKYKQTGLIHPLCLMCHTPKGLARGTRGLLPTWFVYIASKALLNSIACSCFLESLNSTPSALVNFTFFLESKTFWSWQRKVHSPLTAISDFNSFNTPRPYSSFILLFYVNTTRELGR